MLGCGNRNQQKSRIGLQALLVGLSLLVGHGAVAEETIAVDQEPAMGPSTDDVARAVRIHVSETLGVELTDVEVDWLGWTGHLNCPSDARLDTKTRPGETFSGHIDVTVTGLTENGKCESVRIRPKIVVWKNVPVALAAVSSGEQVQLAMGRVALSKLTGDSVDMRSGPWEATKSLKQGEAVTQNLVVPLPAARSGDDVELVAGKNGLTIRASGRLLEDAVLGGRVRVANLATGTVIDGVLVSPGRVRAGGV